MKARLLLFSTVVVLAGCKHKRAWEPGDTCTTASDGTQMVFRLQGPLRITVGACTGPYTVTSLTAREGQCTETADQVAPIPSDIDVNLSTARPSGSFYVDASCNNAVTSVRVLAGTSSLLFYFKYYAVDFVGDASVFTVNADAAQGGFGRGMLDITVLYPK